MAIETRRAGASLVELMVALAIGGLILGGAHQVVQTVALSSRLALDLAVSQEREINAERLLRDLIGATESATAVEESVRGDDRRAEFLTWCDAPGGWQKPCVMTLAIESGETGDALVIEVEGARFIIRDAFREGHLRYIGRADRGGDWQTVWISRITTPVAIGVIMDADTMIIAIGERG